MHRHEGPAARDDGTRHAEAVGPRGHDNLGVARVDAKWRVEQALREDRDAGHVADSEAKQGSNQFDPPALVPGVELTACFLALLQPAGTA
jgi:hypothetical protein